MKHLHDAEFVDLIEGVLAPERVAHVRSCSACRAQVDAMQSTLASARVDPDPEPGQMFWQHFTTRVNARIDAPKESSDWFTLPRFALGAVGLLVLSLVSVTYFAPRDSGPATDDRTAASATADPAPAMIPLDDFAADEGWAFVLAAAEELDVEEAEAAGLMAGPDTVERVAAQLTEAERAELVRLIETELKRTGA